MSISINDTNNILSKSAKSMPLKITASYFLFNCFDSYCFDCFECLEMESKWKVAIELTTYMLFIGMELKTTQKSLDVQFFYIYMYIHLWTMVKTGRAKHFMCL